MFKILGKEILAPEIYMMQVHAPRIAYSAKPGQFLIVRMDAKSERVPLTICDYDRDKGTVTIIFQAIGNSTRRMSLYNEGESFIDLAGPLGVPSEYVNETIENLKKQTILFIAGGVGAAPVYPQVKWMDEHGIKCDVIIGSKSEQYLILEEEMKAAAGNLYIATDDGSKGFHGMVTNLFKKLVDYEGKRYDRVIVIGPMIMMKFVCSLAREYGIKTIASLNTIMVDGTGMCGACRVTVGGETKFACVDGPEFDGQLVDFDEAIRRQTMYKSEESKRMLEEEEIREGHICHVGLGGVY